MVASIELQNHDLWETKYLKNHFVYPFSHSDYVNEANLGNWTVTN